MRCAVVAFIVLFDPSALAVAAEGTEWSVQGKFDNDDAAMNLSGAACGGPDWCLAVNDEKNYAQFFRLQGGELDPRGSRRVRLLDGKPEADLEAAAYADGWLYAVGSHGAPRNCGEVQDSRFFLFRFPVDPVGGEPEIGFDKDHVVAGIERSGRLRLSIRADGRLQPFAEKCPETGGANIEGMAVHAGRAFFGFRAPVLDDGAVVLEVGLAALFSEADLEPISHVVQLGAGYGIRDMAALDDAFLLLAGASTGPEVPPVVWLWRPGEAPVRVDELDVSPGHKAETLLLLGPPHQGAVEVLVLFDGVVNGSPTVYRLTLPQ